MAVMYGVIANPASTQSPRSVFRSRPKNQSMTQDNPDGSRRKSAVSKPDAGLRIASRVKGLAQSLRAKEGAVACSMILPKPRLRGY